MRLFKKSILSALTAVTLGTLPTACAQDQTDQTDYGQVAMYVANMLQNRHYTRMNFDDEVSQQLLDAYLGYLDYNRLYFTKQEVDKYQADYGKDLDRYLLKDADISPAMKIYDVYKKRVEDRVKKIGTLLETKEFTFDTDRTVERRRKDSEWPKDEADADALWERIIESQLLDEELSRIAKEKKQADKVAKAKAEGKEAPAEKKEEKAEETSKEKIVQRYDRFLKSLDENDEEDICNIFLSSLAGVYDPHSEYFSQSELENFQIGMSNHLIGIGALLRTEEGAAKIEGLVVGGPAEKAGELQINDRVVGVAQGIDGEMVDIMYMKLNKVVDLIRGEEGSLVRLKVIPADSTDDSVTDEINIIRAKVDLKDKLANAELIDTLGPNGEKMRYGWINLYSFYADMEDGSVSTTRDVRALLDRLVKEKISGLVLDLRGNGGGSLEEAINLTGLFIRKGPVVQAKDWRGKETFRSSTNRWPVYEGPMIVLTDRISASASEILAAALQDYGRALVVGDKSSFGKGTVQTIMQVAQYMPLFMERARAGALKVTIQKFYRISGGSTQLRGVIPDVILPSYRDSTATGEEFLDHALPYDEIKKQKYAQFSDSGFQLDALTQKSAERVKAEQEFEYIKEDSVRIKVEVEKNSISLNLKKRLAENEELIGKQKERNAKRRIRYAEMEKAEEGTLGIYKLTLDNVGDEKLTLAKDFDEEKASGMIQNHDEEVDGDAAPKYPNGLDPIEREALSVLGDLVLQAKAKETAKAN
jgi:carboxyl-terminal processing protease